MTLCVGCAQKLDQFIVGMLAVMPEPGTAWKHEDRRRWLETAESIFDLIYTEESEQTKTRVLRRGMDA